MRRWCLFITTVVLLALGAVPCTAQTVRGRVMLQGSGEPISFATVELLDRDLQVIARMLSAVDGTFSFNQVQPGRYHVQASRNGAQTAMAAAEVGQVDRAAVDLELPSPVVLLALTCPAPTPDRPTSVLIGAAFDNKTGVALPAAKLDLRWKGGKAGVVADASGHFRFCEAPAEVPLTLTATSWGRSGSTTVTLTDAVHRVDVPVALNAIELTTQLMGRSSIPGAQTSIVTLLLRDARTGEPLRTAQAGFGKSGNLKSADQLGQIRFEDVSPGEHYFRIQHLGYGERFALIDVPEGQDLQYDVNVPPQPVSIAPITVTSETAQIRTSRESPTRLDVVSGAEMASAEQRAATIPDLIRQKFPALFVSEGAFSTLDNYNLENIVCIESVRRLARLRLPDGVRTPYCEMVIVVVDGTPVRQGGAYLRNLSVRGIESLEFLNPLEAAAQIGGRSGETGALVLWTRGRGPYRSASRNSPG